MEKKSKAFEIFDETMTQLLKVPHSEIKEKLDKEKKTKGGKKQPTKDRRS